ncbi:AmmeMemoRadiSam system protein B [Candidatus Fermentibacteria bacterium]|nr:AmmeMemoRadiSam system protein B [Candidatus Fermentibacteria bacterium]
MRWLCPILALLLACGAAESPAEGTDDHPERIREPVAAGSFYPADSASLALAVDAYLDSANADPLQGRIISGVVPHAGYVYSGRTAAEVFSQLEGCSYDVVYVMAPCHRASLQGFSVYRGDGYRTPLGVVPVASEHADRLRESHPSASYLFSAHEREHAIEVELPFLQRTLDPGFSVVPLVVGHCSVDDMRFLAELIYAEASHCDLLVLASSDLSHYPPEELAREVDSTTIETYLEGNPASFADRTAPAVVTRGVSTVACGRMPMVATLCYQRLFKTAGSSLLHYGNSADTGGDPNRTVGYAAIATTVDTTAEDSPLSARTKNTIRRIVREELQRAVEGRPPGEYEAEGAEMEVLRGVFVTYKSNGELRGCIGTIRPLFPLVDAVAGMARSAATEDPRFEPIGPEELPSIDFSVSVLTPLQLVQNPATVEVGRDGLYLLKGGSSGVLLPQVPVGLGWSREEFLQGVSQKAGLYPDAYRADDAHLFRFQAEVFGSTPE